MLYMVTFTINIPQMLAYIPAPWILWDITGYGYPIVFFLKPPIIINETGWKFYLQLCNGKE